ncbi:MAG: hypothetical protein GY694_07220 [Gammaproteobacteria bacterium]|nr:hypothetical protein [Gammaproteobacteria bacterium]
MNKYCIVFLGEIDDAFQLDAVKINFKRFFKLTDVQTEHIFSGKEIFLKKDITQEEALKFAMQIDEMGGISYIEPIAPTFKLPDGLTQDRRFKYRRKFQDRRHYSRAGIHSDRRFHSERRKEK